ncbi:DoxX family protein [Candidatus Uhrbacteria bacterium]|nr:DoxX family protein [Candidatus Uhrbacteria bacterium]
MDYVFLLGRVLYGGFFLLSGLKHFRNAPAMTAYAASKRVPYPNVAVLVSGLLIVLGGLWVILGAYKKVGLLEIVAFLGPVAFMMHDYWNEKDPQMQAMQKIQFSKNMALLGAALMMLMLPDVWPLALNVGW